MIFLSATTPNTAEFSDWIGRTRKRPVHVVTTNYRPVPLQHYLYAGGEMFKVLDSNGGLDTAAYTKAGDAFMKKDDKKKDDKGKGSGGKGGGGGGGHPRYGSGPDAGQRTQWQHLINKLKKESLLPTVVFSFSKRRCEECADYLRSDDLNDKKEKSQVIILPLVREYTLYSDLAAAAAAAAATTRRAGPSHNYGGYQAAAAQRPKPATSRENIRTLSVRVPVKTCWKTGVVTCPYDD